MEDIMTITPLGSGQEVGRSCHLLQFLNVTILLDCGIHPGYDGMNGLPFLDRVDPETVDVLLISHFHLDHAASLPYFTERTNFKGRVFMTHPTKAVIRLLLGDYLRLMNMKQATMTTDDATNTSNTNENVLYTEAELQSCVDKIELIDYHQTISLDKGIQFVALNAGHVLGAAMFYIDIGGRSVLYTGDYSMEEDRHLMAAEIPTKLNASITNTATATNTNAITSNNNTTIKPDVLIVESTYGVQVHPSRIERETRFTSTIERIVSRGGKCLIPVFALGRAQELLLILDEYWHQNPHLHKIPIYYASKMASRALRVYQTYINMMNIRIRAQMDLGNPFQFQYIQNLKSIDVSNFDDRNPSVVFASPGMLQSGVSRQLFDRWASDPKNGVMIAGYAVENTLAKEIMNGPPKEVLTLEGRRQPLNCLVDYVSFSAHVDFVQNRNFITKVDPKHVVLVHGAKDEMGRLKKALMLHYRDVPESKKPTITMPPNLQDVKFKFTRRRSAKVMGVLASSSPSITKTIQQQPMLAEGTSVKGIMVTQSNFSNGSKIVAPQDLSTYTPLRVGSVSSKLHVPFVNTQKLDVIRLFLTEMFSDVSETTNGSDNGVNATTTSSNSMGNENEGITESMETNDDEVNQSSSPITIFGLHDNRVTITIGKSKGVAVVEWIASPIDDIVADSVVALLMHAQSSSASIRLASKPCFHRRSTSNSSALEEEKSTKRIKGGHDDSGDDEKKIDEKNSSNNKDRIEALLRLFHDSLLEQFTTVEAVYDINKVSFEIQTDLKSSSTNTQEQQQQVDDTNTNLICNATVEFEDSIYTHAKITVECSDSKFASNIQICLKSIADAAVPLGL